MFRVVVTHDDLLQDVDLTGSRRGVVEFDVRSPAIGRHRFVRDALDQRLNAIQLGQEKFMALVLRHDD